MGNGASGWLTGYFQDLRAWMLAPGGTGPHLTLAGDYFPFADDTVTDLMGPSPGHPSAINCPLARVGMYANISQGQGWHRCNWSTNFLDRGNPIGKFTVPLSYPGQVMCTLHYVDNGLGTAAYMIDNGPQQTRLPTSATAPRLQVDPAPTASGASTLAP